MTTTIPPNSSGISKENLKYLAGVLAAGAIGGLLFWVAAKWTGTPMPSAFGRGTVLALMFVGALAAAFGVYLLTASDPTAIRTYVFAVVCGLVWQPMIESAKRIATNATVTNQNARVDEKVDKIKTATTAGNVQQIDAAVRDTVPAVNEALKSSRNTANLTKKAEIANASKQAINALQSSASAAPEASVDALKNISVTAANSGEPAVAIHAVESLNAIGALAVRNRDATVANNVSKSLAAIARQSSDPSVRNAAQTAAARISRP